MPRQLGAIHIEPPASVPLLMARARLDKMVAPTSADWHAFAPADGDPLGNDTCGCCVEAWDYQEIRLRRWNAAGDTRKPTAAEVINRYTAMTGYNPATGTPDIGTDTAADTLDYCTNGIRLDSQTIDIPSWALIDPKDFTHMKIAIAHCCAIAITVALPAALQDDQNFDQVPGTGEEWKAGSWGMHRVGSGKYDGDVFTIRTWGEDKPVHPDMMRLIIIAAEVRISRTWLRTTGLTPSGLDWDALMADKLALKA